MKKLHLLLNTVICVFNLPNIPSLTKSSSAQNRLILFHIVVVTLQDGPIGSTLIVVIPYLSDVNPSV